MYRVFSFPAGLCGTFDKNVYNDFYLPSGKRYTIKPSDRADGALSPDDFSEAWRYGAFFLLFFFCFFFYLFH